ncbi:recombination mediator RecR [Flammeovirgaceae bacterium SG7u.111]|nr:recombination mediator RecR [Flammeovirgaceae bacterium SG7u.132]WPO35797.1 recombination mediator RecR [Flammeovirgaceae bacterium SG7u.111]
MNFPSKLVESAVEEISKLPGIGKKTALRLALFLLKEDEQVTNKLSSALVKLRTEIKYCKQCFNISDEDTCSICSSPRRDNSLVCVVENSADLLAIENTSQFNGTYHVLGGVISPIDGIGPSELRLGELIDRCSSGEVKEIVLALSATMEADTTAFYITKKMKDTEVKISTIARGVPIGSEIEYTDEVTLGRSILKRIAYE